MPLNNPGAHPALLSSILLNQVMIKKKWRRRRHQENNVLQSCSVSKIVVAQCLRMSNEAAFEGVFNFVFRK
jgi:hypothetical protein